MKYTRPGGAIDPDMEHAKIKANLSLQELVREIDKLLGAGGR